MKSFKKQTYEEFFISASILDVKEVSDSILLANSVVLAEDKDGTDVTSTVLDTASKRLDSDPSGTDTNNMLSILVKAGTTTASPYKITFRFVTTAGNKWEVDVRMRIVNI